MKKAATRAAQCSVNQKSDLFLRALPPSSPLCSDRVGRTDLTTMRGKRRKRKLLKMYKKKKDGDVACELEKKMMTKLEEEEE